LPLTLGAGVTGQPAFLPACTARAWKANRSRPQKEKVVRTEAPVPDGKAKRWRELPLPLLARPGPLPQISPAGRAPPLAPGAMLACDLAGPEGPQT
jgi:hypothetical protein